MSNVAINVESLGKLYKIGSRQAQYNTLRDSLSQTLSIPIRMLRGQGVAPRFGKAQQTVWALKDVSFKVQRGDVVGIIGRNGAGKSTLLKILSRITEPTTGLAQIRGRVGSLLEVGTGFHPELTGRENVFLNGAILGMSRREIKGRFDEIVSFAGIEKFIDTPVKRYSSGMYMRLAFAVAAHLNPEILLIDEVLSVGDAEFQRRCLGKMHDVAANGRTVLFVSHNLSAVRKLCNQAYLLNQGELVAQGSTSSVLDTYYRLIADPLHSDPRYAREVPHGAVRYSAWSLQGADGNPHHYRPSHPIGCVLEFRLIVRRQVRNANFSLRLLDDAGNTILGLRRGVQEAETICLSEGTYMVEFSLPTLSLRPGHYTLLASVGDLHDGTLDEWYAEPPLVVLPILDTSVDTWGGLLIVRGNVRACRLEQPLEGGTQFEMHPNA